MAKQRSTYRVVQGEEPTAPMGKVVLRTGSLSGAKKYAKSWRERLPYDDEVSVYREESTPGQFTLMHTV